ncbi:MAG TPA: hypothetical protein VN862_03280 [Candidatus Acidoferrales bacterium]|nr:hypothetical protein [Candidatus Acidoferrales bacterium]
MANQGSSSKFVKSLLSGMLAGAFVLASAGAPRVYADDRADCQRHVEQAQVRLDDAVHKYGEHSKEAQDRLNDLDKEHEKCWNKFHQWWDAKGHEWHNDRDWDKNDHNQQ